MFAIVGAAIAPGIAILCYIYLRDHLQPEPISMVIRTFLFGILLVFPIMLLQHVMQTEWDMNQVFFQAMIVSALVEEFFKWLVVYHSAYNHVEFDEPYDGIVYAVSVSLGFATLENFLYLVINGLDVAFWRALLPVSSHALFGIWMGYYMGLSKFSQEKRQKKIRLLVSFVLPVLLHGCYNLIFLSTQYWLLLIVPFMVVLWWNGLKKVRLAHEFGSKNA